MASSFYINILFQLSLLFITLSYARTDYGAYRWKGCYKDTGRRALRYGPHRWHYSIDKCYRTCKDKGYQYFALQAGSWCSCDHSWSHATKYGRRGGCPSSHKGAGWRNDIFKIKWPRGRHYGRVHKEASGKTLRIRCKSNTIIKILQASYGQNCKRRNKNNQQNKLRRACDKKRRCNYKIDHRKIGDPARGCGKDYTYEYQCKRKPRVHKRVSCPRGSRTLGRQGRKNDIGGCGLQGCNARYRAKSIGQCARKCQRNRRCRSYSWAPKGGDRNHRSRNVCTLYDKTRANNKWGPNQVMCKRPKTKSPRKKKRVRRRKRRRANKVRYGRWKCTSAKFGDRERKECIRRRIGAKKRRVKKILRRWYRAERRRGFGRFRGMGRGFRKGYRMGRRAGLRRTRGALRGGFGVGGLGLNGGLGKLPRINFKMPQLKDIGGRRRPPYIRLIGTN